MGRAPSSEVRRLAFFFALGALAALLPVWFFFGFTIDDALIPARYAHHVATGHGYVFNEGGPVTDGVTPLGFVYLLVPFAKSGPLAALDAARYGGATLWVLASGGLAIAVDRVGGSKARYVGIAIVAASAPLGAWASAGLETPLAAAFVTAALVLRSFGRSTLSALVMGLAAGLRPEALPLAFVLAFPAPSRVEETPVESDGEIGGARLGPKHFARLALAALPFVTIAIIRHFVFGRAAPLSVIAKPPDPTAGAIYAFACFLLTGPVALMAPLAFRKLEAWPRWLIGGALVHFAAVAAAGGDWMPLSRLCVPVLPVVALAAAHVASVSGVAFTVGRLMVTLTGELFAFEKKAVSAPRVMEDRLALIAEARPILEKAHAIATEDAGWVGAATESTVVDLAGVTDPAVALLPGSHTDKRIPDSFLDQRGVDVLVLQLHDGFELADPWWSSHFARGVERYIALGPGMGEAFEPKLVTHGRLHYVILVRVETRVATLEERQGLNRAR